MTLNILYFFVKYDINIIYRSYHYITTIFEEMNTYNQNGRLKETRNLGAKVLVHEFSKKQYLLLQGFFLAGNSNKSDHYSEQDMYNELVNLADKGEINRNKIPKVQTIKGWISRYSRQIKKEAAEKSENDEGRKI